MTECCCYFRFSPKPSADDIQSLATQEAICREYCLRVGLHVKAVYADPETSGRKLALYKRSGGQQLLQAVAQGCKHVVVYRLDRIFRRLVDGIVTLEKWKRGRVTLHLAGEGGQAQDIGTPTGWLAIATRLLFAEFEPMVIGARTSDGMKRRQSNGESMGGRAPYGYKRELVGEKWMLVRDVHEFSVLLLIVRLDRDGMSSAYIADHLNSEGWLTRNGKRWRGFSIGKILARNSACKV